MLISASIVAGCATGSGSESDVVFSREGERRLQENRVEDFGSELVGVVEQAVSRIQRLSRSAGPRG